MAKKISNLRLQPRQHCQAMAHGPSTIPKMKLQVKNAFTMSAAGTIAPVFISVCGLNERELSPELCPDGVLLLEIPGLCVGGGDIQTGVNAPGFIVFI